MEAIVISKKKLDELLKTARNELELAKLRAKEQMTMHERDALHRSFNFIFCRFVDKIKEEY